MPVTRNTTFMYSNLINKLTQVERHQQDIPETVSAPSTADQRRQVPFHPKIQFWEHVNILGQV